MVKRIVAFSYGIFCYGAFLVVFLYAVGFVAGIVVPKTIDAGAESAVRLALVVDLALLGLFALQHSVMARPAFKRWWTRLVPKSVERSTFVLASSAALALLFWQWRPIPTAVWNIRNTAGRDLVWTLAAAGWLTVFLTTFMISHAHLFGVSQVWSRLLGREAPGPQFQTKWLYGHLRHPLMLGFLVAFWAAPSMSAGHLLFAAASTGYILVATLLFEERDLEQFIGEPYREYRRRVPAFIPRLGRGVSVEELSGNAGEPEGARASDHG